MTKSEQRRDFITKVVVAPLKVLVSDWRALVGGTIILAFLFTGIVGPHLVEPPSPTGPRLAVPFETMEYPLGTTGLGQGVLSQIVHATPAMLKMIAGGAVFATSIAAVLGVVSGYKLGWVDTVITSVSDMFISMPGFPLIMIVAAILAPENPFIVGVVLSVNAWAGLARMVRSETLTIRNDNYIEAARTMDVPTMRILAKDVFPNLMPYIAMHFVIMARRVIFHSVGLYFLGILPFTTLNWGVMINMAYQNGAVATARMAHWLFIPMLVIIVLTTGLTLFAQSADTVFNPRMLAKRAKSESAADSPGEPSNRAEPSGD